MIGDKLVITEFHRQGAAKIFPRVLSALNGADDSVAVSIAGESGSGKSEIANCLAGLLEAEGWRCLILCQDDYFRLPPKTNYWKRRSDIAWVGTGEVRLDLIESHVRALREHPDKPLSKPLMMFEEDAVTCEIVEPGVRNVIIVEGCYTSLVDGIDIRVFIDRDFRQTERARKRRNRDPNEAFLERVLAIEHQEISTHRDRADITIDGPDDDL